MGKKRPNQPAPEPADKSPAADAKQEDGRSLLAFLREQFEAVEWIEPVKFWQARVWCGGQDFALITVVSSEMVGRVASALARMDGLRKRLAAAEGVEAAADVVAAAFSDDALEGAWVLVADLLACCVTELHLPEYTEATGRECFVPVSDAPVSGRIEAARFWPVVLLGRVLIGIGVQAGQLLTRSGRA